MRQWVWWVGGGWGGDRSGQSKGYNQTMSFLRYSSLAFLMSFLDQTLRVASTFLFSAPLDFLIFLLSSFSALRLGFFLGRTASLLRRQLGSYLTRYCWLSQLRQKPVERFPPKAVLNPNSTRFLISHLYLLAMSSLRSFWETLGLPSWYTSSSSSFLASSLFTRSLLVLMVIVILNNIQQKIKLFNTSPPPPHPLKPNLPPSCSAFAAPATSPIGWWMDSHIWFWIWEITQAQQFELAVLLIGCQQFNQYVVSQE